MIKKPKLGEFLRQYVGPEFDRFFLYRNECLIRVSSIFAHGIWFQRSRFGEDFYAHCFVEFLPDGLDFVGLTIGERVARVDSPLHYRDLFALDPPEREADQIVASIRANRHYPHIIHPTCRSLLEAHDSDSLSLWANFGLACCAIMEGERDRAARLLKQFDDIVIHFDNDDARAWHKLYLAVQSKLNNLDRCREFLWQRAEESIRLKKLEKIAELSGWKPG